MLVVRTHGIVGICQLVLLAVVGWRLEYEFVGGGRLRSLAR